MRSLVMKNSRSAKTFFALVAIAVLTIIIAISNNNIALSSSALFSPKQDIHKAQLSVNIIDPAPKSTITSNVILVNGTTFDSASRIQKVEVLANPYPFSGIFNYKLANQISEGNWSKWSISIPVSTVGIYRILAHVSDNVGNENWTELSINVPFFSGSIGQAGVEGSSSNVRFLANSKATTIVGSNLSSSSQIMKIAIVIPTFTEAAYSPDSFYTFYAKYQSIPLLKDVKTDLNMLNPHIQSARYINPNEKMDQAKLSFLTPADPDDQIIIRLVTHLQKVNPHALITIIRDEDIHNGYIFTTNNDGKKNNNVYDLLILAHGEYATQTMYNNYMRFVRSGGTVIGLDGNLFFAEVRYNKDNSTITFVKGHGWEFDGNSAKKSVRERWFNQTREWIGSNFLESDIHDNITFKNNPFDYKHFEENFVNNPDDKILINYGAVIPRENSLLGATVATYEHDFVKGKVILIGLYGQKLIDNDAFLKFIDSLILKYVQV
jgi:hypothetical protein